MDEQSARDIADSLRRHLAAADAETARRDASERVRQQEAKRRITVLLQRRDWSTPVMGMGALLGVIALLLPSTVDKTLLYFMGVTCFMSGAVTWELASRAIERWRPRLDTSDFAELLPNSPVRSGPARNRPITPVVIDPRNDYADGERH